MLLEGFCSYSFIGEVLVQICSLRAKYWLEAPPGWVCFTSLVFCTDPVDLNFSNNTIGKSDVNLFLGGTVIIFVKKFALTFNNIFA